MEECKRLKVGERLFIWILTAFSLFVLIAAYRISGFSSKSAPGTYPMATAAIMVVSLVFIHLGNRKKLKPEVKNLREELKQAIQKVLPRALVVFTGLIIGYMVTIQSLGFVISSYLFLLLSMIYLKGSTLLKSFLISGFTLAVIYVVFQYIFTVVLP